MQEKGQWKDKERQRKGQRWVKERQRKGSGRSRKGNGYSRKGSGKVVEGQGNAESHRLHLLRRLRAEPFEVLARAQHLLIHLFVFL